MAGKGAKIILVGLLSLSILLLVSKPAVSDPDTEVKCAEVINDLTPCLDYVTDKADAPSAKCCSGAKALNSLVKTKADRQAACECIKKVMDKIKYDASRVLDLPKKCGISFQFPPSSPEVDCSKA